MKTVYRLFSIAFVSIAGLAGFAGCAGDGAPKTETVALEASPETTVVRYGVDDLAALKPGESLRLDLTLPNTVYAITYADPAALGRFVVVQRDGQYTLRDRAPATAKADDHELKQVVVSADQVTEPGGGKSLAPLARVGEEQDLIKMCKCPCCIENNGNLYCCE